MQNDFINTFFAMSFFPVGAARGGCPHPEEGRANHPCNPVCIPCYQPLCPRWLSTRRARRNVGCKHRSPFSARGQGSLLGARGQGASLRETSRNSSQKLCLVARCVDQHAERSFPPARGGRGGAWDARIPLCSAREGRARACENSLANSLNG